MENSNSREYLEKITAAVIDNLRNTGPAPSVQMQDVPRKPFGGMTDEEEAELDDLDEDENKDVRMTEHRWDKRVENGAEFEPSDDDDLARVNGATRQSSNKRTFTDFGKDTEEEGTATATQAAENKTTEASIEDSHDINDDTIEDIDAAEQEKGAVDETVNENADKEKTDGDGDVGMADMVPAEDEDTKIKKEEPETEAAPASEDNAADTKEAKKPAGETAASKDKNEVEAAKDSEKASGPQVDSKSSDKTESKDSIEQPADAMDVDGDKEKETETKDIKGSS